MSVSKGNSPGKHFCHFVFECVRVFAFDISLPLLLPFILGLKSLGFFVCVDRSSPFRKSMASADELMELQSLDKCLEGLESDEENGYQVGLVEKKLGSFELVSFTGFYPEKITQAIFMMAFGM